jgi:hypothetical protein
MLFLALSACSNKSDGALTGAAGNQAAAVRGTQELILDLEQPKRSMRRVYLLSDELRSNPQQVELTQELTLDETRPAMGLKGSYGLFASEAWWDNINSRRMPLRFVSGTIIRAYEAGQDQEGVNNTVELRLSDGAAESVGIYVNDPRDVALFKEGKYVMVVYAVDELKSGSHSLGNDQLEIALEMAISVDQEM